MNNLETNLRSAAREAFRLYPEIYRVNKPTDNEQLEQLAHEYGIYDGFYDAGMSPKQCEYAIKAEWSQWVNDYKEATA